MNLRMGSQVFTNVEIPLLWGTRAVLQDEKGRLTVVNLDGGKVDQEVLADRPAPGVKYRRRSDGFVILKGNTELYLYNPSEHLLDPLTLSLPACQVTPSATRVGGSVFSGNMIEGFGVGIAVTETGMAIGAPLPPGLAKLRI